MQEGLVCCNTEGRVQWRWHASPVQMRLNAHAGSVSDTCRFVGYKGQQLNADG